MKQSNLSPFVGVFILLSACTSVQFKDVEIVKLEKVVTQAQPELKDANRAFIGEQTLKVYFTSKTDFSEYGLKKLAISGPLYINTFICSSVYPLASLYNGPETIDVNLPDLFFNSIVLNRPDRPRDRIEALDNDQVKTFYFFVVIAKGNYNLVKDARDLCFKITALDTYPTGKTSKTIRIEKERIHRALE